jgi:MFS family permease
MAAPVVSSLSEPTARVSRSWIALLTVALTGLWAGILTPVQLLLPQQVEALDAASKVGNLGLVHGIGAAIAIVANPLFGALSDRTTGRFGRRHPWTVGGVVVGALSLGFLSGQTTLAGVIVGWILVEASLNAVLAALTAALPDRVPVSQRGVASAWSGIAQPLGPLLGLVLATFVLVTVSLGYLGLAVLLVVGALPFVLLTPDERLAERPAFSWRGFLAGFWVSPRRHPDFAWAWGTRFLVQLANAFILLYLYYFLQDAVGYPDPSGGVLVLTGCYVVTLILAAMATGWLSDRSGGRRKVFVLWSGVVMTLAAALIAVFPVWPVAIASALILGFGYGAYQAVDLALITQVLPTASDRAKDLGVINIANAAPQVLAPAIAAPVITYLGGYPSLYALTGLVALLGCVFVYRIRSVP